MKIVLLLTSRGWKYKLRASRVAPGSYYVCLRSLDGAALNPSAITGSFPSLDAIIENAEPIYRQLSAMREANSAAVASLPPRETTLNHSAEFSNSNP